MVRYLPQTVIQMDPHKSGTWVLYEDYAKERDTKDRRIDTLERQLAELREAAEAELVKLACAGVEKLTEIAPDAGWDSGEVVAEMYIRRLPDTSAPKDSETNEEGSDA